MPYSLCSSWLPSHLTAHTVSPSRHRHTIRRRHETQTAYSFGTTRPLTTYTPVELATAGLATAKAKPKAKPVITMPT